LQIEISGLPRNNPAVTISGPNGYSRALAASAIVSDLVPGTYVISAARVTVTGLIYAATDSSQTVTVSGSASAANPTIVYVSYTPAQPALLVIINGLPPGVFANVAVIGQSAGASVYTTTTVTVPAGTYTVSTGRVSYDTLTYGGTPATQTVTLDAGTQDTVTVAYGIVPNTIVAGIRISAPGGTYAGSQVRIQLRAVDSSGQPVTTFSRNVLVVSSDVHATGVGSVAMNNGFAYDSLTLNTVGTQTITVVDPSYSPMFQSSIPIDVAAPGSLLIVSGQPPDGHVGYSYGGFNTWCFNGMIQGFILDAAGVGRTGARWYAAGLPPGVRLDAITLTGPPPCATRPVTIWVLDGTPTQAGTYSFTLSVSSGGASASRGYTITIH
jgi:hypothetical protein